MIGRRKVLTAAGASLATLALSPALALSSGPGSRNAKKALSPSRKPHPQDALEQDGVMLIDRRTRQAIGRGLDYLSRRQNEDGSFGVGPYARNVGVCSLIGMAYLSNGSTPGRGPYAAELRRCVDFILSCSQDDGFITNPGYQSHGPMYGHGFATLLLSEVFGMTPSRSVREQLSRAVTLILDSQNDEGGWRYQPQRDEADLSVTVCQVMALRAARNAGMYVPNETVDRAVEYVKRSQNPDGGFMYMLDGGDSDFPRSAAGIVALYSAGIYEGEELRRGLEYLDQFTPTRDTEILATHFFYGHYYAVQAKWHSGGEQWQSWYPAIRDLLLDRQVSDGQWVDSIGPEYGTAMASIILQMPNSYLPIFQREVARRMNDPRRFSPGILVGLLAVLALAHLAKSARCIAHPRLFEDGLHREVVRSDGSRLAARIVSVDRNWNVRVETDDRQFVFNETELVYWGHVEPIVRGPIVVLDNGDMIVGEVRRIFTDRIAIESRYWQAVEVPLDRVVGVLLRPALDPLSRDQQILTLLDLATDRDQVKLTTGDSLSGFVMESLSAENEAATPRWKELGSVVVELDGESIQLPSNSIESIRWSGKGRERDASRSTPRFIGMRDGSWFACDEVRAQRDHVEFRLSCGVTLKTRIADGLSRGMRRIGAVYPAQEQFVFLSRLKPAQFQSLPALTSSIPYAADRNVRGGMLRKSNALIPFGIGMHSAASLAFATDGDFRRLRAELALDRCAGNGGSVVFTIHVSRDGTTWEQAYSSPVIRGGDKSLPIDVDITEAKYVALGVGFADRGDVLDHANWLHARLVK